MKDTIKSHIVAWFKVSGILWVAFLLYAQWAGLHDALTFEIVDIGAYAIRYYVLFYFLPKMLLKLSRFICARISKSIASVVSPS